MVKFGNSNYLVKFSLGIKRQIVCWQWPIKVVRYQVRPFYPAKRQINENKVVLSIHLTTLPDNEMPQYLACQLMRAYLVYLVQKKMSDTTKHLQLVLLWPVNFSPGCSIHSLAVTQSFLFNCFPFLNFKCLKIQL